MIVKFFGNKKGGSVASINYLLDKRTQQGTARILQGDEKLTRAIIESMSQKNKTCMGCLAFEESNIDEELKFEIMQSFENMLLTPEMQGRYNILWVEHIDKGRLELNFVIPKIDLESKKAFNPYFHKIDFKRRACWSDLINLRYGFTNPKDPAKAQSITNSDKKKKLMFKDYEKLDEYFKESVALENFTSRAEIIEFCKENDIEVTREGKDYLGLKLPDSKKAKRFKGGIYDSRFTSISELENLEYEKEQKAIHFQQQDNSAEIERLQQELDNQIKIKSEFYAKKIQETQENNFIETCKENIKTPQGEIDDHIRITFDTRDREVREREQRIRERNNQIAKYDIKLSKAVEQQDREFKERATGLFGELIKRIRNKIQQIFARIQGTVKQTQYDPNDSSAMEALRQQSAELAKQELQEESKDSNTQNNTNIRTMR